MTVDGGERDLINLYLIDTVPTVRDGPCSLPRAVQRLSKDESNYFPIEYVVPILLLGYRCRPHGRRASAEIGSPEG